MVQEMLFFIVEQNGVVVGFFNLKCKDKSMVELFLIYFVLDCFGKGFGFVCIDYIEKWLLVNWMEVEIFIVDMVILKYNSGFYKKVGFKLSVLIYCEFLG